MFFVTCDNHLLSGVTPRLSYTHSNEDFRIRSEDTAKHYNLQILDSNLYFRKMNVTDPKLSAIESTTPAYFLIMKKIPKHFLQQLFSAAGNRRMFLPVNL